MKKLLVVLMLIVSVVCSSFVMPIATAETNDSGDKKATNGTSYLDYIVPNKQGEVILEENTGDMNRVAYNNDVLVPLSGGTWGRIVVADFNDDGYLDFEISGNGFGEKGTWLFYGNPDAFNPESENYMVMGDRRKISDYHWIEGLGNAIYDADGNYVSTVVSGHSTKEQIYITYDAGKNTGTTVGKIYDIVNPGYIDGGKIIGGRTIENFSTTERISSGQLHRIVDINGDGLDDFIYTLSEWGSGDKGAATEHGDFKYPKYDANGIWGDDNNDGVVDKSDPDHDVNGDGRIDANDVYEDTNGDGVIDENDALCGDGDDDRAPGYIMYLLNKGTNNLPVYQPTENNESFVMPVYDYEVDNTGKKIPILESKRPLVANPSPSPDFADYDKDGDLDILCADFIGYFTYYENIGTATNPIYIKGQRIKDKNGNVIMSSTGGNQSQNVDWNQDGFMDMVYVANSDEAVVYLLENTGRVDENNLPIFTAPKPFMCRADNLKFAGWRAASVDWDKDGDEDLVCTDSGGHFFNVKNLTIEKALEVNPNQKIEDIDLTNPIWAPAVELKTPDNKPFIQKAGYKGDPIPNSDNLGSPQGPTEVNFGYVQTSVVDWDCDGTLDIVYLDSNGRVRYLKGIEGDFDHVNYPQNIQVEWTSGQKKPAWYDYFKTESEKDLVTIWRTDPTAVDLPLDEDGDGIAEGDGLVDLVLVDHEGYFAFYQRYRDRDGSLKLREGKRIFRLNSSLWAPTSLKSDHGKCPMKMIDWDGDGDLDMMGDGSYLTGNVKFYENVSTVPGEYNFVDRGDVHTRALRLHETTITFCDWNKDGIPDLLTNAECGNMYYLVNNSQTSKE